MAVEYQVAMVMVAVVTMMAGVTTMAGVTMMAGVVSPEKSRRSGRRWTMVTMAAMRRKDKWM